MSGVRAVYYIWCFFHTYKINKHIYTSISDVMEKEAKTLQFFLIPHKPIKCDRCPCSKIILHPQTH